MRGGLDDALDKLARRDELRRRTAGEATGTPPAVQELVEAIAGVVGRNPKLTVTVGVEGVGDPTLLHFAFENGLVQVSADHTVASRSAEPAPVPRHADFDLDLEEPAPEPPAHQRKPESGQETRRINYEDRARYDPGTGYPTSGPPAGPSYADDILFAEHPYESHRKHSTPPPAPAQRSAPPESSIFDQAPDPTTFAQRESAFAQRESAFPRSESAFPRPESNGFGQPESAVPRPERSGQPDPARPTSGNGRRMPEEPVRPAAQRGMPPPLPKPIPLKVDSKEAEQAAKRLAALLRDNPSLLRHSDPD